MPRIKTTSHQQKRKKKSLFQDFVLGLFKPMTRGQLTVNLPGGGQVVFGQTDEVNAEITIHCASFFDKCALYGDVGFGESYVDGHWDSEDIVQVINWMILNVENHPTMMDDKPKMLMASWLRTFNRMGHWLRDNSPVGSHKNISAHYDLSNDFFKLMLDDSMLYSAAYFKNDDITLEQAQLRKCDELCKKLQLTETDHLLEIGTGWGGMAIHAAKYYGCKVTTTTISQQQYDYAQKRIFEEGLEGKIELLFKDYRYLTGTYDKLVSIEMIEAVGHKHLVSYFQKIHKLVKKNGLVAIQGILSPDHRYESFRKNVDWIQKYIFPGSLLPSITSIQGAIAQTGDLILHDFEDMTLDYAQTLRMWRQKFYDKLDQIEQLGFDQSFTRKWDYYLCYCESAFAMRNISVAQMVFTRPNNITLS